MSVLRLLQYVTFLVEVIVYAELGVWFPAPDLTLKIQYEDNFSPTVVVHGLIFVFSNVSPCTLYMWMLSVNKWIHLFDV